MARITIEAETPQELLVFVRQWLQEQTPQGGDAEGIAKAVRHMYGGVTRGFIREVAEASVIGEKMIPDGAFAQRYGKEHAGQLGGAIGAAWVAFGKYLERPVLRNDKNPTRYWMTKHDAEDVLAALGDAANG